MITVDQTGPTSGTLTVGDTGGSYLQASGSPDGGDICGHSVEANQGGCLSDAPIPG